MYAGNCRQILKSSALWFTSAGGFAIQAYKGAQKPSPMEVMHTQATQRVKEPATFKPPKLDIPVIEGTKQLPWAHNLKPQDLNVLTPIGFLFWGLCIEGIKPSSLLPWLFPGVSDGKSICLQCGRPGFHPWVTSGSSTALPGPSLSIMDSGSRDKDRGSADKWSLFGPRSFQKSDSGGFAI